jgi:hypothetical protein
MWACASVCAQESHVRTKATGSVLPDSFSGAFQYSNQVLSSRYGDKRDDDVRL